MNTPANATALFRALITYAVVVPLALVVGYTLTNPLDYSFFGFFGIMALLLASPLLLRWHHPLLVLSWNMSLGLFFVKGTPNFWLLMVAVSLGISVLERALDSRKHFIRAPQITWPLLCLTAVVLVTAKMTGGIGLHVLGSDVYGGKKYIYLFGGILSYFALTAKRIPRERAWLYVGMFFLGGVAVAISDLYPIMPSWTHFIFLFYNPTMYNFSSGDFALGETRLAGVSTAGYMVWCFLMARYGIRGIFLSAKPWRLVFWFAAIVLVFTGGFRFRLIAIAIISAVQFFLERMHRTRLLPVFAFVGIFGMTLLIPLASHLPFTFQRTLAILPLHLSPDVRMEARGSLDWRLDMWRALMPQVYQHLLVGKGFAISPEDYTLYMGTSLGAAGGQFDASQDPLALSYDYHSGPLSVLIPFGVWGAVAVLWLLGAGLRVLFHNYKYGDPALKNINLFLFAAFMTETFMFLVTGGAIASDIATFAADLGLSISLNGGVCRPATQQVVQPSKADLTAVPRPRPRLLPVTPI